jgi:flagellar basal-body rod protein FlgC
MMSITRTLKLGVLAAGAFLFLACGEKSVSLMTYNTKQKSRIKNVLVYNKHEVEIFERGNFLTITKTTKAVLTDILQTEYLNIQLVLSNINNANTTKAKDGYDYKKQKLFVSDLTGIRIMEDPDVAERLVYDPTNPEAIRTGKSAGFVKFPNINVKEEYIDLIDSIQLYNAVVAYAKANNSDIIITELFKANE